MPLPNKLGLDGLPFSWRRSASASGRRAGRIWLDCMLRRALGKAVDWNRIDREDYMAAMECSPVHDTELRLLLRDALTDRMSDRAVFMHGVDASYAYEGYTRYKTEEL